ncbi:MAG TPA: hypothetical protein EYQ73_07115 [Candidatus Poseidoniales archaeon]|jgi:hypothetical protein|nr:MAG: hypothetical protein CXT71_05565 [Euryarchaeota archaeon]HIF46538.1 hypothetical protein [Candidatus Poseidoniales archaeon]HIL66075.1 hypothetical protein [Candidatus Poseidoniales archaeon]
MKTAWFHQITSDLRTEMKILRWLLIRGEDLPKATAAWMFAELDGCLIAVDSRGMKFESGVHNRAIHLLLCDDGDGASGITKVVTDGELVDHIW